MSLKIGDVIQIKNNLNKDYDYSPNCIVNESMIGHRGKLTMIMDIEEVRGETRYRLSIDRSAWAWTINMFTTESVMAKVSPEKLNTVNNIISNILDL